MSSFAVRPDDLRDAAALTATDGDALGVAGRLVAAASDEATAGVGPAAGALAAAIQSYAAVEDAVVATLREASTALSGGLTDASGAYATADASVTGWFRRVP